MAGLTYTEVDGKANMDGLEEDKDTYCNGSDIRRLTKNGKLGQSDGNLMTADSGLQPVGW